MFLEVTNLKKDQYTIHIERESVCMGDDCNAPNPAELPYSADEMLSEWLNTVAEYVPTIYNTVWTVQDGRNILGYLIFDEKGRHTCETAVSDIPVTKLKSKHLFCRYFYQNRFLQCDKNGNTDEKPLNSITLLEQLKQYLKSK